MKQVMVMMMLLCIQLHPVFAQSIGIGTNNPNASALLDVNSQRKGVLLPSMPLDSIKAIVNPKQGLLVYDNEFNCFRFYDGKGWKSFGLDAFSDNKAPGFLKGQSPQYSYSSDGVALCTDASSNVYMTGSFGDSLNIQGQGLKDPAGLGDIYIAKFNKQGVLQWLKKAGGADFDAPDDIAIDGNGNLYVCGMFNQTASFGSFDVTSGGGTDMFVAQYNSINGSCNWVRRFGSTGDDEATALSIDKLNNICFAGFFNGTVSFDAANLSSAGASDVVVVKMASNGFGQWARRAGGTGADYPSDLVVNKYNQVFAVGTFTSNSVITVDDLGTLTGSGTADGFLLGYRANGSGMDRLNTASGSGGGSEGFFSIAADTSKNLYVTGSFSVSLFGLTTNGSSDMVLAKYDTSFARLWAVKGGGAGPDDGQEVGIEASGNIYLAGKFSGTAQFGVSSVTSNGNNDIYLAKYSPDGNFKWVLAGGGPGNDLLYGMAIKGSRVWISGRKPAGNFTFYNISLPGNPGLFEYFLVYYDE